MLYWLSGVLGSVAVISSGIYFRNIANNISMMKKEPEGGRMPCDVCASEVYSASATIREISHLEGVNISPEARIPVDLKLEILPAVGEPYETMVKWEIENAFLKTIRPGGLLKVRIDVNDGSIIHPYGNWAVRLSPV